MSDGLSIPLHLAVHLVGLAAVAGLVAYAVGQRRQLGPSWPGLALGGLLLAVQHVAGGLVLVEHSTWPVFVRAAAYAAIAVGVAGSSGAAMGMPVVVMVAPVAVHVTAGIAGLLAAVSALRGVARRGGLLGAGLAAWAASDMLVRARPALAAWVAVVGSVLVLGWTSTAARTSVRARLLAVITILVSIAVVLVAASTGTLFTSQFRQDAIDRLRSPAGAVADDVNRAWPREMSDLTRTLSRQFITINILGRDNLGLREAEGVRVTGGADFVALFDPDGTLLAGSWRGTEMPSTWVPSLSGLPAVQAAQSNEAAQAGRVLLRGEGLGRTVVAVYSAQIVRASSDDGIDERLGVVLAARLLDATDLESRKRFAGADFAVAAAGEIILSTLNTSVDPLLALALDGNDSSLLVDEDEYLLAATEVGNIGVPVVAIALQETSVLTDSDGRTARELFGRSLLALLVGLLGGVIASRALARPVRRLTDVVDRVAAGDLDTTVPLEGRADELGRLAEAFDDMTVALGARQAALQRAASTEAELRGRLQAITDSMTDGLIATDRQGRVTACNPAAAVLCGVDVDAAIGMRATEVLRGVTDQGDRLEHALAGLGEGNTPSRLQARLDASDVEVAISTSALRGSSGSAPILGTVVALRDVTAEAQLARTRREFVTNISHELRTPLTLIMAPVRQLDKWRTREDIAPIQTEILNRGTARMARLERELTEWAQLELGRQHPVSGVADLVEVRRKGVELVTWQFPDRDVRLRIPQRLKDIAVSTEAVTTIVRELTHNAVLFSKHKAGIVDVIFKNVPKGVELTVRDRGVGMTPATVRKAFEPYWQLDATERRDFDGLGIGLTLADRVARQAGTKVTITSTPGRGTTATVVFKAHS